MANEETMDVKWGEREGVVVTFQGKEMAIPAGWELLRPGDAGLTRRLKKDGAHWVVKDFRHQTTSYDHMDIGRAKGERREVRRMLAEESRRRLSGYRKGEKVGKGCPVWRAVYG